MNVGSMGDNAMITANPPIMVADQEPMTVAGQEPMVPGHEPTRAEEQEPMRPADYRRVEQAIRFLEANATRQPSLDEIADHVGLSKYYFQRMFRRWAGVSPKRFLQYLTVERAKELLGRSESVLDASFETGLSGPGRLHDLFVGIEAATPGEYKQRGAGLRIRWGRHPSPFGDCLIGITERGICWLAFVGEASERHALAELWATWPAARLSEDAPATAPLVERIFRRRRGLDNGSEASRAPRVTLHLSGTNFQIQVWKALLSIPEGALASYADVAREIGRPRAARAVGGAVARNPVAWLIPCHRVIRSVGDFGVYRWGEARKKAMLGWEAARLEDTG